MKKLYVEKQVMKDVSGVMVEEGSGFNYKSKLLVVSVISKKNGVVSQLIACNTGITIILDQFNLAGGVRVTEYHSGGTVTYVTDVSMFGMTLNGDLFTTKKEKVTEFLELEVGDLLTIGLRRNKKPKDISVSFIGQDGSALATDYNGKSYFINRNDRDQLKSLKLKLM
ncbi:hypothetical protein F485_gp030 [Aeromonas phage CC2]|uniref:Uncharacterized protein n=1 Tax=Aeromonas phage CC2 TaxID=1204516 RepID=I6XL86_9CAUD|nr:hypothetical protein F485_gp030 [Aeromonas phage CC2]AFN39284.1 hypothetical protein CC2_380 [Aeromonas phage CC2]